MSTENEPTDPLASPTERPPEIADDAERAAEFKRLGRLWTGQLAAVSKETGHPVTAAEAMLRVAVAGLNVTVGPNLAVAELIGAALENLSEQEVAEAFGEARRLRTPKH